MALSHTHMVKTKRLNGYGKYESFDEACSSDIWDRSYERTLQGQHSAHWCKRLILTRSNTIIMRYFCGDAKYHMINFHKALRGIKKMSTWNVLNRVSAERKGKLNDSCLVLMCVDSLCGIFILSGKALNDSSYKVVRVSSWSGFWMVLIVSIMTPLLMHQKTCTHKYTHTARGREWKSFWWEKNK